MKITWLGHACFLVESESASIVFDPYAPGKVPGLALPPLSADLVISSHGHDDHFYPPAVKQTRRRVDVPITRIETFHDDARGSKRGPNTISVVELDGLRIAHMGDIGHMLCDAQLEKLKDLEVLMIPVGGYYTIDAAQARELADATGARLTVPMHYRGEGFGFDVISTVDGFAALSPDALRWESNVLCPADIAGRATVILQCPTGQAQM